jgi:hypothetical protein
MSGEQGRETAGNREASYRISGRKTVTTTLLIRRPAPWKVKRCSMAVVAKLIVALTLRVRLAIVQVDTSIELRLSSRGA